MRRLTPRPSHVRAPVRPAVAADRRVADETFRSHGLHVLCRLTTPRSFEAPLTARESNVRPPTAARKTVAKLPISSVAETRRLTLGRLGSENLGLASRTTLPEVLLPTFRPPLQMLPSLMQLWLPICKSRSTLGSCNGPVCWPCAPACFRMYVQVTVIGGDARELCSRELCTRSCKAIPVGSQEYYEVTLRLPTGVKHFSNFCCTSQTLKSQAAVDGPG